MQYYESPNQDKKNNISLNSKHADKSNVSFQ